MAFYLLVETSNLSFHSLWKYRSKYRRNKQLARKVLSTINISHFPVIKYCVAFMDIVGSESACMQQFCAKPLQIPSQLKFIKSWTRTHIVSQGRA